MDKYDKVVYPREGAVDYQPRFWATSVSPQLGEYPW